MTGPGPLRCATHPNVETNLRCGKCGKPICPKCMVQTPVGARCRECARLYQLPTYRVSGQYYLKATGTALGLAVVIGVGLAFLRLLLGGFWPFLGLIAGYGIGMLVGEVTSLAVNRKRGRWLAVIGALAVVLAFGILALVDYFRLGGFIIIGFRDMFTLAAMVLGIVAAVNRLR
jgi:hypothetical protein